MNVNTSNSNQPLSQAFLATSSTQATRLTGRTAAGGVQRAVPAPATPFDAASRATPLSAGTARPMPEEMMKAIVEKMEQPLGRPGDENPLEGVTVEEFMKAWGSSEERFDLNGDGTVNVDDFMQFIAELSRQAKTEPGASAEAVPQYMQIPAPQDRLEESTGVADPSDAMKEKMAKEDMKIEGEMSRVDQLKAAWGTDNAEFDLNGDGVVGVDDLLQLLSEESNTTPDAAITSARDAATTAGAVADAVTQPSVDSAEALPEYQIAPAPVEQAEPSAEALEAPLTGTGGAEAADPTMQDFMSAWGSDNPEFDFNNDGTVDVDDLLEFIARSQGESDAAGQTASGQPLEQDVSPLQQLMDAWGSDNPDFDLNGDGTVNIQDLLQMLAEQSGNQPPLGQPGDAFTSPFSAANVSQGIFDELAANGFADQPPTNLNDLIDQLAQNQQDKQSIIEKLAQYYPHGLGINLQS